jgi:hypothetical protein
LQPLLVLLFFQRAERLSAFKIMPLLFVNQEAAVARCDQQMVASDWANVARCAEQRMHALWEQACDASRGWEAFYNRRWREHEAYMAAQSMARYVWRLR